MMEVKRYTTTFSRASLPDEDADNLYVEETNPAYSYIIPTEDTDPLKGHLVEIYEE